MSKNYWFKAKKYGWGWYPATWEGWLVMAVYTVVLIWQFRGIDRFSHSTSDTLIGFVIPFVISTVALFIVCYLKGEKPKWRWGETVTKEELSVTNSEEMFDVLSANGNKTGEVVSRKEAHEKGLWHTGAHLYIINSQNEVLLQLRTPTMKAYPDMWFLSVGGHVAAGDTSQQTIIREAQEEIGIDIVPEELIHIDRIICQDILQNGTYINNEYDDIFLTYKDLDILKLKKQESEVADIAWVPVQEFKAKIKANDPKFVNYAGLPILFSYLEKNANS